MLHAYTIVWDTWLMQRQTYGTIPAYDDLEWLWKAGSERQGRSQEFDLGGIRFMQFQLSKHMLMSHTWIYIISNLSWVTGEQTHIIFKVDFFFGGGRYIPIYPVATSLASGPVYWRIYARTLRDHTSLVNIFYVGMGVFVRGQAHPRPKGRITVRSNFWVPLTYALTLWHITTKFVMVTHVVEGCV